MRYLLRRLIHSAAVVGAVSLVAFAMLETAPGDFVTGLAANPAIPTATVEKLREQYGLDAPAPERYARWAWSMLRGDMGLSVIWNRPVSELLLPRAANTLLLSSLALLLSWGIGVPLGFSSAARRGGRWAGIAATVIVSLPDVIIALLVLIVAVRTGWIPVSNSLAGPVLALTLTSLPNIYRHSRAAAAGAMAEPFVESAVACGLSPWRIWTGHIFPAAANSLISLLGLSLAALLSTSLLVETIFGWPGLGGLLLEAIGSRDQHVVMSAIVLTAALMALANIATDLLLYLHDPRIRRPGR